MTKNKPEDKYKEYLLDSSMYIDINPEDANDFLAMLADKLIECLEEYNCFCQGSFKFKDTSNKH